MVEYNGGYSTNLFIFYTTFLLHLLRHRHCSNTPPQHTWICKYHDIFLYKNTNHMFLWLSVDCAGRRLTNIIGRDSLFPLGGFSILLKWRRRDRRGPRRKPTWPEYFVNPGTVWGCQCGIRLGFRRGTRSSSRLPAPSKPSSTTGSSGGPSAWPDRHLHCHPRYPRPRRTADRLRRCHSQCHLCPRTTLPAPRSRSLPPGTSSITVLFITQQNGSPDSWINQLLQYYCLAIVSCI